jgi:H/ACA ribonucleoprotein complex subunit 4
VSEWTRNILGVDKSGHLGTLDPDVSGVLPVLLGRATNAAYFLMQHDKEYVGIMHFEKELSEAAILGLFKKFTGEIWQIPPVGAAVARRRRKRKIYSLELLEFDGKNVLFDVKCEAGTYIRTLAEDMGKSLGRGNSAKLIELRRIQVGNFSEKNAVTLQELSDAYWLWKEKGDNKKLMKLIHPLEYGVKDFKKIWISDNAVEAICNGAQLMIPGIARFESSITGGDIVVIMTLKEEIVAFAEASLSEKEFQTMDRGIAAKIMRVIMERGRYPKAWKTEK